MLRQYKDRLQGSNDPQKGQTLLEHIDFILRLSMWLYRNHFKSWPRNGIESCRKLTTAGFVNDPVLINTGSFTIVDFRRFEPIPWPTVEGGFGILAS